jgi:hypothetical protein
MIKWVWRRALGKFERGGARKQPCGARARVDHVAHIAGVVFQSRETYLRWHAVDRDHVSQPRAFLMTTTTRICLDMLTSARARREEYAGPWLPEPVVDTAALAPDSHTELAEDLSIALLLTLDRLSPLERAAFLLHDVFDFSFSEVARFLVGARAKGGATTSPCALRPSMVCPVSAWTHPRDRCRPRRSRSTAASSARCTWCAIPTSCAA